MSPTSSPNVQLDPAKAKKLTVYFIAVSAAGIAVIVLAAILGWGFMGYLGGGVLLLGGVGGFAGMKATGGVGRVTCPECQTQTEVMQLNVHRYLECPGCHTWLEGATDMKRVAPGHIAPKPIFTVPLPEAGVRWPRAADGSYLNPSGSPTTCTELVTLEGRRSPVLGMTAPVRVSRVLKLDVPVRKDDPDAAWLQLDPVPTLAVRSFDYMRAFAELNRGA